MPRQKPGKSETIVRTPPEFLAAVKRFLGIDAFAVDLASCADNAVASLGITKEEDAFTFDWGVLGDGGWCWLNPPYDDIAPWVEKCWAESQLSTSVRTAVLIPASVGSNWWRDYVHQKARVCFLNGRILFLDKFGNPICSPKTGKPTPYPKDLALLLYGDEPGYDIWNWRTYVA